MITYAIALYTLKKSLNTTNFSNEIFLQVQNIFVLLTQLSHKKFVFELKVVCWVNKCETDKNDLPLLS